MPLNHSLSADVGWLPAHMEIHTAVHSSSQLQIREVGAKPDQDPSFKGLEYFTRVATFCFFILFGQRITQICPLPTQRRELQFQSQETQTAPLLLHAHR